MIDKTKLLAAVNLLVTHPKSERIYNTFTELAKLPQDTPVLMTGEAEPLNELLALHRDNAAAFENVMRMIDTKRGDKGWEPLLKQEDHSFNRNEYQRDFMQQKRQRERRAVEVENLLRPARDKLIGNARLEFMRRASAQWKTRRDELLGKARAASDNTLSKEQVSAILAAVWSTVDAELDKAEEDAMRKIRGL